MRVLEAQGGQSFTDGRGMMAKIVNDRNAPRNPPNFHAALNAFEGAESGLDLVVFEPTVFGAGHHGQSVAHIEFTQEIGMELEAGNLKLGRGWPITDVEGLNSITFAQ